MTDKELADKKEREEWARVQEGIAMIKASMPSTYKAIQAKADVIGKLAFSLVRRALRGEANCFYAIERGHVAGTPFNLPEINADVAQYMVQFGAEQCCIWSPEATNGAN